MASQPIIQLIAQFSVLLVSILNAVEEVITAYCHLLTYASKGAEICIFINLRLIWYPL